MKIAIVRTSYSPLNTQNYNVQEIGLAKGFLSLGISTDIYSRFIDVKDITIKYKGSDSVLRLIPIYGFTFLKRITYYVGLCKQIIKGDYDLVQVHDDSQLMTPLLLLACKKAKIKAVLYQGMYANYNGINRVIQILFDIIFIKTTISNSKFVLAKTRKAQIYLISKGFSNVEILPVGLDYDKPIFEYPHVNVIDSFKQKFKKTLLYVGVIEERRNPIFLLDLMKNIVRFNSIDIGLIVVGKGPMEIGMKMYANDIQIENHILFIESIPNNQILNVFNQSDILLLPSNYEIYGMVVLEALYSGIPVISTKNAGAVDILCKKEFGCCLDLDLTNWTSAINHYLTNISNKNSLKKHVIDNYDWIVIAKRYLNLVNYNKQ